MGLSMVPESLGAVGQAVLMGRKRFGTPTGAALLMSGLRLGGGGAVLALGGGVEGLALVWALGGLASMVWLLVAAWRVAGPVRRRDWWDSAFLIQSFRPALPFLGISVLMAVEFQLDVIVLSAYHDEAQIGWYSSATTITATVAMLAQAYRLAVYPLMARYAAHDPPRLALVYERSMRWLGILVLPLAGGLTVLAPQILSLIYSAEFAPAAPALRILGWALVLTFLNVPNTRTMYVHDKQSLTSAFLLASMSTNIGLNLALDGPLGARGAAIARLCSALVFFVPNTWYVTRFLMPSNLVRLLYKPALAAAGMAGLVWLVRSWWVPFSVAVGALAYAGLLLAIGGIPRADWELIRRALADLGRPGGLRQALKGDKL
jgi:O-antigen/teichoic acid export membrane protein